MRFAAVTRYSSSWSEAVGFEGFLLGFPLPPAVSPGDFRLFCYHERVGCSMGAKGLVPPFPLIELERFALPVQADHIHFGLIAEYSGSATIDLLERAEMLP